LNRKTEKQKAADYQAGAQRGRQRGQHNNTRQVKRKAEQQIKIG
jgi:hypothetical protein